MKINEQECIGCGACAEICPVAAIDAMGKYCYKIDLTRCKDCGACKDICTNGAITEC